MNEIDQERAEVNLLIERGVSITVTRKVRKRQYGVLGFFKKRQVVNEELKYTIQQPTLAVLDLIASEQLELKLDESVMKSEDGLIEARRMSKDHNRRMAKIVAYSVVGEDYFMCVGGGRYKKDDKTLNELTDIFQKHIKPSVLLNYCILIASMNNLGDFINSIRLMSASRTTMPNRIEENTEG